MSSHDASEARRTVARRGLLFVMSSPSGAGKTSLARALIARERGLEMSVSVTTRQRRPAEVDGRDYHFIDQAEFDRRADQGELIEWARVFERSYGTPRAPVERGLPAGRDLVLDIDWQGTQQVAKCMPADIVTVFILPPSAEVLEQRLTARGQDAPDVVARRMAKAASEISHWSEYDYVLVNEDFEESLGRLQAILAAERMKRVRQTGLGGFVAGLIDQL